MHKRGFLGLTILAVVFVGSVVLCGEPDGRVIIRYEWPKKTDAEPDAPVLRLTLTAVVPLTDAHVAVALPSGIDLTLRAPGRAPALWPREGLGFAELAAGQTVVVDLQHIRAISDAILCGHREELGLEVMDEPVEPKRVVVDLLQGHVLVTLRR